MSAVDVLQICSGLWLLVAACLLSRDSRQHRRALKAWVDSERAALPKSAPDDMARRAELAMWNARRCYDPGRCGCSESDAR